jgi:DNA-binding FadR family transcriptional regulator
MRLAPARTGVTMEPVQKKKLYQSVLDRLIEAIASEEFAPGSQLPSERELMAMIGVGRPSIREAMLTLQQMGLIKISHGERARVMKPTPEAIIEQISAAMIMLLAVNPRGLDELKSARIMIEVGLAKTAALRVGPNDLRYLDECIAEMQATRGDSRAFVAADMRFHEVIAGISGNSLIAAAVSGMLTWLTRFKKEMVAVKGAEKLTIQEHEAILEAIRKHDPEAAGEAMRRHLSRANDLYSTFS